MEIKGTLWIPEVERKIIMKHNIQPDEVEQTLDNNPHFRFVENGNVKDEDVYAAMGQTDGGRCLMVIFIYKAGQLALILSARDMSKRERKAYDRQKK